MTTRSRSDQVRDWLLFIGGAAGVAYETVWEHVDRPWLLMLFAGMLGLPAVFPRLANGGGNPNGVRRRRQASEDDDDPDPERS